MFKFSQKILCIFLFMVLCVAAGSAGAEEELLWPLETKLMCKDWLVDDYTARIEVGNVSMWNTRDKLKINIVPYDGFKFKEVSIHIVENEEELSDILDKKGKPKISEFTYKTDYLENYGILEDKHLEEIGLEVFEICWGVDPEKCPPNRYAIVHAELQMLTYNKDGEEVWEDVPEAAFALGNGSFPRLDKVQEGFIWGYYVTYPLAKVEPGHFIDANVKGLTYETPTQSGTTGDSGQFDYIPEERVSFSVGSVYLGDALGDRRVSPADLFEGADMDDDRVINVAWLLQSLDADGNPGQGGINITEPVIACLESALDQFPDMLPVDFADEVAVGALIGTTQVDCAVALAAITRDEARENLNSGQKAANLMKKNISKTPDMKSDKAKIEIMPVYVPALRSDGSSATVVYHDADGNVIETRNVAKPIVVAYEDEVEGTGVADVFVAISRDDGDTWKRRNISKTANKSSLVGYPGESQKPMLKVKDNMIFVAWTDKYCRGGRPGYAINRLRRPDDPGGRDPGKRLRRILPETPRGAPRCARPTTRATTPTIRTTYSGWAARNDR